MLFYTLFLFILWTNWPPYPFEKFIYIKNCSLVWRNSFTTKCFFLSIMTFVSCQCLPLTLCHLKLHFLYKSLWAQFCLDFTSVSYYSAIANASYLCTHLKIWFFCEFAVQAYEIMFWFSYPCLLHVLAPICPRSSHEQFCLSLCVQWELLR